MRNSCLFIILVCVLSVSVLAAEVLIPADVSCRTEINNPTTNRHDSSKLSIRSDASSAKSWIKWTDLDGISPADIRFAELRLTSHETRPGTFHVSAVNDDCLDNIGWLEREITWSNAPANDTASLTNPDFTKATEVGIMDFLNTVAGDQRFIDVTSILQADTDGIVQFILHNSTGLMNMSTHDHPSGAEYYPTLFITLPPAGADWPDPEVGEVVLASQGTLSWTNPEPNFPGTAITCEVYLGTEPNRLDPTKMNKVPLAAGANSVAINTTNFKDFGALVNNTTYYWFVDCYDPSREPALIPGEEWSFTVGQPPAVNAGPDQAVWLPDPNGVVVNLDGTVTDDGSFTVLWTQVANGAPTVSPSPDNIVDTSVTITARGDYEFMLTATDNANLSSSDTVRVVVGDDACDASHIKTGADYNDADQNQDCIVDLVDFVALIIDDWLNCTDTLTNCN